MTALDVHEVVDAPPAAPATVEPEPPSADDPTYRSDLLVEFRKAAGREPSADADDQAEVAGQLAEVADDPAPPSSSSGADADPAATSAADRPLDARIQDLAPEALGEALDVLDLHRRDPQRTSAYLALKSGVYGQVPPELMATADRWFSESRAISKAERTIGQFESAKIGDQPRYPDFARLKVQMGRMIEKGTGGPVDLEQVYVACGGKITRPPPKPAPSRAGSYHDDLRRTLAAARRRAPR